MSDDIQRPALPKPAGLRCWRCGHQAFRVIYTRRRLDALVRGRKCLQCGTRFTTWERQLGT
jgi:transcriptional regulator NrdR family protein